MFGYCDVNVLYDGFNLMFVCVNLGWKVCKWSNGILGGVVVDVNGMFMLIDDY